MVVCRGAVGPGVDAGGRGEPRHVGGNGECLGGGVGGASHDLRWIVRYSKPKF